MKTSARFLIVTPAQLASYLRSHDWQRGAAASGKASTWTLKQPRAAAVEVTAPLITSVADYAARVAELVQTVAKVEGRPSDAILADLEATGFDVVRIGIEGQVHQYGTVKLSEGIGVLEQAREALLATACATVEPRAAYDSRKPDEASRYMEGVRLGQTERGSYVVTIQSPITPPDSPMPPMSADFAPVPFERRVVTNLARAVDVARAAAERSRSSFQWGSFAEHVDQGVNANLCEAMGQMVGSVDAGVIRIGFTWSPLLPLPDASLPKTVILTRRLAGPLKEAAARFRAGTRDPLSGVIGSVIKLDRRERDELGTVTVHARVAGRLRNVRVVLPPDIYERAIAAHAAREEVRFEGPVRQSGRTWYVEDPVLVVGPRLPLGQP